MEKDIACGDFAGAWDAWVDFYRRHHPTCVYAESDDGCPAMCPTPKVICSGIVPLENGIRIWDMWQASLPEGYWLKV